MKKPLKINEILIGGGARLTALKSQTSERAAVLAHVCAALPPNLAKTVASAGLGEGQLTLGVVGAAWASRLRYVTETLRKRVSDSLGVEIRSVRIKVVPPHHP
jgi:hypothetical protein